MSLSAPASTRLFMARGPKRKSGRREANGRVARSDQVNEPSGVELHRIKLMESNTASRDARLSTPLGLIRARTLIAENEYQAGLEFEKRWVAFVMPENPRSCLSRAVPGETGGATERDERRYRQACDALATAGLRAYHHVVNVVGYKHWPRYLDTESRRLAG